MDRQAAQVSVREQAEGSEEVRGAREGQEETQEGEEEMTVSELVTEAWRELFRDWFENCGGGEGPNTYYEIPVFRIEEVMRSLGIWDAEVLELVWDGGYGDQSEPEEYERAEFKTWDGKYLDSDAVFREGQRIRIIVLPQEEK